MTALAWDTTGQRFFELGVDHGVLYPYDTKTSSYPKGVAWNGLTSVNESPEGAEPNDMWADNMKYATIRSTETFGGTIEAYTYPDEFELCDGSASVADGVTVGQQTRSAFGLCYRTRIGNDVNDELGYKLHLVYGATASPSEKSYETINDSPDAITFSWEFDTTPVAVAGYKPTSLITIDSTKADPTALASLLAILYGGEKTEPRLPLPDEVIETMGGATSE